ncbi:MAG TPA: DNA primase [Gammaproteobacteria bacterium]|nr:DNA primase [Gammaproteobacteria bacterium]
MGLIPQYFIDDLVAKTDIVEIIEQRVPLKKQGREFAACCPFHNEKTPSFTVSPEKQFYHCFGCGVHGTAIGFLMEYENLDFVEAIEVLAENLGVEVPHEEGGQPHPSKSELEPLYEVLQQATLYFQQQLKSHPQAIDYLKQRGLSGAIARDFQLGFAAPGWDHLLKALSGKFTQDVLDRAGLLSRKDQGRVYDKFRERIMFPIRNRRGQVIAFGGRIIGTGEPKYLNSPETPVFNKSDTLYGLYEARKRHQKLEQMIVVEGYMDVVALAQHGICNAVATLGTATTAQHLKQLFRNVHSIVFCFDGDRAGREAAWRALEHAMPILRDGQEIRFLFLPDGEDPDSYVREQGSETFNAIVAEATPLSTYLLDTLKARHNCSTMEGRGALKLEADQLMAKLPAHLLAEQLQNRIGQITSLEAKPQTRPQPIPQRNASRSRNIQVTSMRLAIASLLQHPELISEVSAELIDPLEPLPGGSVLKAIYSTLLEDQNLSPAMLSERFREGPHQSVVDQLMAWMPPASKDETWKSLLQDALAQLHRQVRQQRLSELLHRSNSTRLSTEEKQELQRLLAE